MPSAYLQWRFHSGERVVARGPLVLIYSLPPPPPSPSIYLSHVSSVQVKIKLSHTASSFVGYLHRTNFMNAANNLPVKYYVRRPWWLSWMRRPTGDQEVAGSTPAEVGNILSWRLIMKYFLRSFSPFR